MRALTPEEALLLKHMCAHAWSHAHIDRTNLAAQVDYLTTKPGCEVENCPCLDFDYRGNQAETNQEQIVLVMDIKDSEWQANLFVSGGIIRWLEFSSFGEDYPVRLPEVSELC